MEKVAADHQAKFMVWKHYQRVLDPGDDQDGPTILELGVP